MTTERTDPNDDSERLAPGSEQTAPRRRLAVTGLAAVAVAGVSLAGLAMTGEQGQARAGEPAAPAAAVAPAVAPAAAPAGVARSSDVSRAPARSAVDVKACLTALAEATRPGLRPTAGVRLRLDTAAGTTLVIADQNTWLGCDRSRQRKPSVLEPGSLTPPSTNKVDPFRVSSVYVTVGKSLYERYWAAGVLPAGVTAIKYTFPDGARRNAKVAGRFWAMQYQQTRATPPGQDATKLPRIKVDLVGASGRLVKTFRLDWGTDTCAHINHGC